MHMQMEYVQELPTPEELKRRFPVSSAIEAIKEKRDEEIAAIFEGKDPRFILIIGPCSADREDAVVDYMPRLAIVQEKDKDSQWAKDIVEAYHSKEFKEYLEKNNNGLWFVPEEK